MTTGFTSPPLGLSAEETAGRFDELQRGLAAQWTLIQSMNQLEQTMVVVPSVSVDIALSPAVLQAYEERMLFLLLLLRKPRAHIIYCSSQPIREQLIDYYLGLLPGVIPSHARRRLTTLAVHDGSPRPLSLKILERPRTVERLRGLISDPATTHMVPFNTTTLERDLAVCLGIPMYASDPRHAVLGTKSGSRRIFAELGVPHPRGAERLHSVDEVVEAVLAMRSAQPALEQLMLKLDHGVSGMGNAVVTLSGLPPTGAAGEAAAIRDCLAHMRVESSAGDPASFLRAFEQEGGVAEERLLADELRSPSVQLRNTPLGQVEVLSTHDQILGGSSGQSYLGCRFPAAPSYAAAITGEARKVGEKLRELGVLGRYAVDFVVARERGGGWRPYAIEINLRKGGTTGPFLTLEFLTNGRYDAEAALFRTPAGRPKYYVASDHVESPAFRAITPDELFDFVVRHGLHFDHTTQTGVVLHMLGAITEVGQFGLTAVADSADDARELYDRTIATLGFEAERASDGSRLLGDRA